MFSFFKKKESTVSAKEESKATEYSPEELEKYEQEVAQIESEIQASSEDPVLLSNLYEKLGLLQSNFDMEKAIISLEKSLDYKPNMGDGYKKLMSLYNQMRSQAAYSKDGDAIDYWMNKMEEMRQLAKKLTVSGQS